MLGSFRKDQKPLKRLFQTGRSAKVSPSLHQRCVDVLDTLRGAQNISDLNLPGYKLHQLRGAKQRWAIRVNESWRIIFDWDEPYAQYVALVQYH
jgi:toxin HigB-1